MTSVKRQATTERPGVARQGPRKPEQAHGRSGRSTNRQLKWVFCGGMMRSGSTLQYNIASEIVERRGIGRREIWIDDHRGYFADPPADGIIVFKAHELTPPIADAMDRGEGVAIVSIRDIRDATASWQAKTRTRLDTPAAMAFAQSATDQLSPWEQLPADRLLVSRYESMVGDLAAEVSRIAGHIGIALEPDEIRAITRRVDASAMASRVESLGLDQMTQSGAFRWDTHSLVHVDHFNGGTIGRHADELPRALGQALTRRYADWLLEHGYSLRAP